MTAAKRFQITGVSMITGMERMEWKMNVHSCVAAITVHGRYKVYLR